MRPKNLKYPFKWENRRPHYSTEDKILYIPDHYTAHDACCLPSMESVFGNILPVKIEYCSGNGAWLIEKAKENPHINWIGVEWRFERARKIWSKMKNEELSNVMIVAGEALTFTKHYLPQAFIEAIYVNFPDPWPKERHAKNRLFQEGFTREIYRILKPQGSVTVATDDPVYAQQITGLLLEKFSSKIPAPYYLHEWLHYGASYFDTLWRSKGKKVYYFQFQKVINSPYASKGR